MCHGRVIFPTGGPFLRHPSQLYEAALEGLVLFLLLRLLTHGFLKLKSPGFVAGAFVTGYGLSRIFVEFFREPDAQIGYLFGGWLTMGMVLSLPMVLIGFWAMADGKAGHKACSRMTPLRQRIAGLIEAAGRCPSAEYMAICLFDPGHGYYTTREPFGRSGDFITAPEISQMFGELVAVWLRTAWDAVGRPLAGDLRGDRPRPRHADEGYAADAGETRPGARGAG